LIIIFTGKEPRLPGEYSISREEKFEASPVVSMIFDLIAETLPLARKPFFVRTEVRISGDRQKMSELGL